MIHFSRWCGGIHRAMLMFLHFPFMRKKGGGGAKKILKQDTIMQFPLHSSLGSIVGGHDIPPLSLFRCICKWDQTPPNLLSFNTTSLTQNTNTESNNNSKERKLKKKIKTWLYISSNSTALSRQTQQFFQTFVDHNSLLNLF